MLAETRLGEALAPDLHAAVLDVLTCGPRQCSLTPGTQCGAAMSKQLCDHSEFRGRNLLLQTPFSRLRLLGTVAVVSLIAGVPAQAGELSVIRVADAPGDAEPPRDGGLASDGVEPPLCAPVGLSQSPWRNGQASALLCHLTDPTGDLCVGRAFQIPAGSSFVVSCVNFKVELNTSPIALTANLWLGHPLSDIEPLVLLASKAVDVPEADFGTNLAVTVDFSDDRPIMVAASGTLFVEIAVPTRDPAFGGPGGMTGISINGPRGVTGPTIARSVECGVPEYFDLAETLPSAALVLRVDGEFIPASPCPADLDLNGQVTGSDLGVLLSQWGGAGSADFDESGTVGGEDLGALLSAWGLCG